MINKTKKDLEQSIEKWQNVIDGDTPLSEEDIIELFEGVDENLQFFKKNAQKLSTKQKKIFIAITKSNIQPKAAKE